MTRCAGLDFDVAKENIADIMLEIWLVNLERSGSALDALEATCPKLDIETKNRLDKLTDAKLRLARRRAHIALRHVLKSHIGLEQNRTPFVISKTGRPSLDHSSLEFSLSHTDGWALIGIKDCGRIGVDIEPRTRTVRLPKNRRAEILAGGRQLQRIANTHAAQDDQVFLTSWVSIEAYAKATGVGVGRVLEGLRQRPSGNRLQTASMDEIPCTTFNFDPNITVSPLDVGGNHFAALAQAEPLADPIVLAFPEHINDIKQRFGTVEGSTR